MASAECLQPNDRDRLACYDAAAGYQVAGNENSSDAFTFDQIEGLFGAGLTDAQLDYNKDNIRYFNVAANGRVDNVSAPGFLSKTYDVRLKHRTVDVVCKISPDIKDVALRLSIGDSFTCNGIATNVITTFGSTTVFVEYRP